MKLASILIFGFFLLTTRSEGALIPLPCSQNFPEDGSFHGNPLYPLIPRLTRVSAEWGWRKTKNAPTPRLGEIRDSEFIHEIGLIQIGKSELLNKVISALQSENLQGQLMLLDSGQNQTLQAGARFRDFSIFYLDAHGRPRIGLDYRQPESDVLYALRLFSAWKRKYEQRLENRQEKFLASVAAFEDLSRSPEELLQLDHKAVQDVLMARRLRAPEHLSQIRQLDRHPYLLVLNHYFMDWQFKQGANWVSTEIDEIVREYFKMQAEEFFGDIESGDLSDIKMEVPTFARGLPFTEMHRDFWGAQGRRALVDFAELRPIFDFSPYFRSQWLGHYGRLLETKVSPIIE